MHEHQTGLIWRKSPKNRSRIVSRVCKLLKKEYGTPRLGNPRDPIDDLIYIIITNKTSPKTAQRIFSTLKKEFRGWNEILEKHYTKLRVILKPAGLSHIKSQQIRASLQKIKQDFGSLKLMELKQKKPDDIEKYLTSLPGVSEKVAKCVMLYTLDINVLPVDSHVHRVSSRLGWTNSKRADQSHQELEALVPSQRRYAFHVDCILHGRQICRPKNPSCNICVINRDCNYYNTNKPT